MSRPALALLLGLLAACAPHLGKGEPRSSTVRVGDAQVRVLFQPEDAAAAALVAEALAEAIPQTERWGGLPEPITLTLQPSHAALEEAVDRPGYPWLRAWAKYATVQLQSPSSWPVRLGDPSTWTLGGQRKRLVELLTHELTHCAVYQRAGTEWSWSFKGIPLWFGEGMASHTAGQGYKRGTVEDLWRFYHRSVPGAGGGEGGPAPGAVARAATGKLPEGDPLANYEQLYQDRDDVVYGAAHHAFTFLQERYGPETPRQILDRMHAGATFAKAFRDTVGLGAEEFTADFRRYVVLQGWRR